jgi:hypothetical protein
MRIINGRVGHPSTISQWNGRIGKQISAMVPAMLQDREYYTPVRVHPRQGPPS